MTLSARSCDTNVPFDIKDPNVTKMKFKTLKKFFSSKPACMYKASYMDICISAFVASVLRALLWKRAEANCACAASRRI